MVWLHGKTRLWMVYLIDNYFNKA